MIDLSTPVEKLRNVGTRNAPRLKRLGIKTLGDLLRHFPSRYEDYSETVSISDISLNQKVNIQGQVVKITTKKIFPRLRRGFGGQARRLFITDAIVKDLSGAVKAVWFNQPFIENQLPEGTFVSLAGKLKTGKNGVYLASPTYEKIFSPTSNLKHTKGLVPVYPETEGITSKYLRFLTKPLLSNLSLADPIPESILKKYNFPSLSEAIKTAHFPDSYEQAKTSKERLAFEDLMLFQMKALLERRKVNQLKSVPIAFNEELVKNFINSLPFELTKDQKIATLEILRDLEKSYPMNRLLEGDVGSGKTVVALIAAYQAAKAGYQTVFLVPTEVLAQQHHRTITSLISNFQFPISNQITNFKNRKEIQVGLLTGSETKLNNERVVKPELKKKIANGEVEILIGTHAVIQKDVIFDKLALVIIDEQHRFGVDQRARLVGRRKIAEETQSNAENTVDKLLYRDLTYKIRGAAFNVRKILGGGHSELVYQRALAEEFKNSGLEFIREKPINIFYKNTKVGVYQPDFIVENSIIVELKALPFLGTTVKSQIWKYLKGSKYKLALLFNFGSTKLDTERLIYENARIKDDHSALVQQSSAYIPHLLSMTATPIPRTLALTVYGDLDISIIKEKPKNRQKIITKVVSPAQINNDYKFLREEIKKGRQIFVVCPRIEDARAADERGTNADIRRKEISINPRIGLRKSAFDQMKFIWSEVKAVEEEYKKLSEKVFPDLKVAMLHGKLKPKDKISVMNSFKEGFYDILVSTSVIEVGVDIPNATIMAIESAERFGLAQLHQFRGRVGRGEHQSYCFLLSSTKDSETNKRLKALVECDDGFELAEKDMAIRGPGEFMGTKQSGMPDLAMASLANVELIKKSRAEARLLLKEDPALSCYPLLKTRLEEFQKLIHFE